MLIMDNDVLNALKSRACYITGGRDYDGRIIIIINILNDLIEQGNRKCLETCINYIKRSLSNQSLQLHGLCVLLDGQKYSLRSIKNNLNDIIELFNDINNKKILLVRSDCFWEKHVDHCAKLNSKDEPILVPKTRLNKFIKNDDLAEEYGGNLIYNHELWLQSRMKIDDFKIKFDKLNDMLDNLHKELLNNKLIIPSGFEIIYKSCSKLYSNVQNELIKTIAEGNQLLVNITNSYLKLSLNENTNNFQNAAPNSSLKIPQDLHDGKEKIQKMLNDIEKRQTDIYLAWQKLQKYIENSRKLLTLEEGVSHVTNSILSTAEQMLNKQYRIGCDVTSSEELRTEHEKLELHCSEIYGYYAELLYRIEIYSLDKNSLAYKDLIQQKDFMDFVCRSFATRIERRRNLLIISLRFYRLVSEYFDKTTEVFETLVMDNKIEDFNSASNNLQKLKDSQHNLEKIERDIIKDGEKLSDILSMPIKDSLGRDLNVDYSDDIINIKDILDATISRRNIFIDSVELQKLTLEQITHIHKYENDLKMTIKWMNALYNVMIKCHTYVGCNVHEIQIQKDELQTFQETGKNIFNYGCQLIEASLSLRLSCKLNTDLTKSMSYELKRTWYYLQTISQEHMIRLRVSGVFHRSVEEYCNKLNDLKLSVKNLNEISEPERRRLRLRKYLTLREHLLVEVGRMVRLGKLLKTRLRESFILDDNNIDNVEANKSDGTNINSSNDQESKDADTLSNGKTPPPTPPALSPSTSASSSSLSSSSTLTNNSSLTVISPTGNNAIACDSITYKLSDISEVAESLDSTLRETQNGLDLIETNSSSSEKKFENGIGSSFDDYSLRSTEDESFMTASECNFTPQSRSSSFQTASETRTLSPYWSSFEKTLSVDATDDGEEISEIELDSNILRAQLNNQSTPSPNIGGSSGTGTLSSANVSFDSSDYLSAQSDHSPLLTTGLIHSSPTAILNDSKEATFLDDSGNHSEESITKSRSETPTSKNNDFMRISENSKENSNQMNNDINVGVNISMAAKNNSEKVRYSELQPIEWDESKLYKSSVAKQAIKRFL